MNHFVARLFQRLSAPLVSAFQRQSRRIVFLAAALFLFSCAAFFGIGAAFLYLCNQYDPLTACGILAGVFIGLGVLALAFAVFFGGRKTRAQPAPDAEKSTHSEAYAALASAAPHFIPNLIVPAARLASIAGKGLIVALAGKLAQIASPKPRGSKENAAPLADSSASASAAGRPRRRKSLRFALLALAGGLILGVLARRERRDDS